jgi:hypothetical protein
VSRFSQVTLPPTSIETVSGCQAEESVAYTEAVEAARAEPPPISENARIEAVKAPNRMPREEFMTDLSNYFYVTYPEPSNS